LKLLIFLIYEKKLT